MKKSTILSVAASAALLTGSAFADTTKTTQSFKITLPEKGASAAALANTMPKQTVSTGKVSCVAAPKIGALPSGTATANASISYIGSSSGSSGGSSRRIDGRVKAALDAAGVKYQIMDSGAFKVTWTIGGGPRSHVTIVDSQTSEYNGMELREIWASGFEADSIDKNNLQALLELNSTYKLGGWQVVKLNNGKYRAIFGIKVSADAGGDVLRMMSSLVANTADEIELKATNEDKL